MSQNEQADKVLIVDDDPINRQLLMGILGKQNYVLSEAHNGVEAVSMAREIKPDIILLDIMMPGKDGFDVCKELKQDEAFAAVPIVFLSTLAEVDQKMKALKLGAVDYLTKPFNPEEVMVRVENHLKMRRSHLKALKR